MSGSVAAPGPEVCAASAASARVSFAATGTLPTSCERTVVRSASRALCALTYGYHVVENLSDADSFGSCASNIFLACFVFGWSMLTALICWVPCVSSRPRLGHAYLLLRVLLVFQVRNRLFRTKARHDRDNLYMHSAHPVLLCLGASRSRRRISGFQASFRSFCIPWVDMYIPLWATALYPC